MSKIIILNGGSCSGKSTIAKEICRQSGDKFVHLGVDEFKRFLFTIVNHDNIEHPQGQKICNRMLITAAKAFLDNGFNVVIDTIFYGKNAQIIAKIHLDQLKDYDVLFVGVDLSLEEKLRRFKDHNNNPVRNEKTIISQDNVFELCREMYDETFNTYTSSASEIAEIILRKSSQTP